MNKISKKIVSLVTMAAFALTLVPAAAFAQGDTQTSGINIVENGQAQSAVTVEANEPMTAQFFVRGSDGYTVANNDELTDSSSRANVRIWASDVTDSNNVVPASSALQVETYTDDNSANGGVIINSTAVAAGIYATSGNEQINNGDKVTVKFTRPGTYVLYAGIDNTVDHDSTDVSEYTVLRGATTTITVTPETVDTASVNLDVPTSDLTVASGSATGIKDNDSVTVNPTSSFRLNGIQTTTITATALQADNSTPARNETFNLSSSSSKLVLDETQVTTDENGKFDISFSINGAGTYRITVAGDDLTFTIVVYATNTSASTITTIADNAQTMLAGSDRHFTAAYGYDVDNYLLDEAVQFEIVDASGNVVVDTLSDSEPAVDVSNIAQHGNYLKVTPAEGSSLQASNLKLAWSEAKQAYTVAYVGDNPEDDLVPGAYTVTVGLLSGATATAEFTLANYGTTQDMVITVHEGSATGRELTDEVVLASASATQLVATAQYVDENGIKITANGDVQYGFNGRAVNSTETAAKANNTGVLQLASESLLGSVVTVTAVDTSIPAMKQVQLTVVDGYNEYSLAFDGTNGLVDTNNKVQVSVVDEDGNVATDVNGTMLAYVDSQTTDDAVVEVAGGNVRNGVGTLTINSDLETGLVIAVAVKDNTNANESGSIYVGSLEYTIGEEDINADTLVGMTIGSSNYIVDNDVVEGDAAPYVDSNWRTMVPIRALAETFGATVDFTDNVVTIVDGDTTVVMTIGETTYTVNDDEATMDTAPVIGDGDRTYVPVRFVAEALGYTVTPLQDANGLTASVVFQK